MAYDEESLFAGIAIGKAMKGWSRAPAKGGGYGGGTVALHNYSQPFYAVAIPKETTFDGVYSLPRSAKTILVHRTTQATYTEVTT